MKNINENIASMKRMSSMMPKSINEALNFEEHDEEPLEMGAEEEMGMEEPKSEPIAHGDDSNVEGFIANMRKESLGIMKALADDPDNAVYQFAKKIFQLADKAHEDQKEGKDINGQPKDQMMHDRM